LEEVQQAQAKEYEQQLHELQAQLDESLRDLEKANTSGDDKDLEVSRLRRETDDLQRQKKNASEKMLEYQSTNERLRKDKDALEQSLLELRKRLEMAEMLQKSAAMVMDAAEEDENSQGEANLQNDLGELEDMDTSFNGGSLSGLREIRRGTIQVNLNQSMNSDNQEFHQKLFDLQQQNIGFSHPPVTTTLET